MEQKHFMDIERAKLGDEITSSNIGCFEVGDHIVIQEKIDGANAAIAYDSENHNLAAFSRKKQLDYCNTLNGFWNWVQELDVEGFREYPNYVFFGEWLIKHTIRYSPDSYRKFYFYDVYDKLNECYLEQSEVQRLAKELSLVYVNTLYDGEFRSWEHCESFMNKPAYGEKQEGIVVKNQTRLNNPNGRLPFVLKIVSSEMSEIQKKNHKEKIEDPQRLKEQGRANTVANMIVTRQRVEKELHKMADEGIIPDKLVPEDMAIIAKVLPKRIYADCLKEEKELVEFAGNFFGRACSAKAMNYAKEIVC